MYSTTLLNVAVAESTTALAPLNDLSNCLKKKNQLKHRLCTDGLAQSRDVQAPLHGTALLGGTMVELREEKLCMTIMTSTLPTRWDAPLPLAGASLWICRTFVAPIYFNTTNESAILSCSSFGCVNFKVPVVLRGFGEIGERRWSVGGSRVDLESWWVGQKFTRNTRTLDT